MTASILQSIYQPPKPPERPQNIQPLEDESSDVAAANANGQETEALSDDPQNEQPAEDETVNKPADQTAGQTASKTEAVDQQAEEAPQVAADSQPPKIAEDDRPKYPAQFVTIGSIANDSPFRYLVTLDSVGGAIRRVELNYRKPNGRLKYRDLEFKGGYMGQLDCLQSDSGCEIRTVGAGTPAAKAGLQVGDVIQSINDQPIQIVSQFDEFMAKTKVGREIKVDVLRDGKPIAFNVTLGDMPIEVIRPEPDTVEPGKFGDASFLTTLRKTNEAGKNWTEIDPSMTQVAWKVDLQTESSVQFSYSISDRLLGELGLAGPVNVIKRFSLPKFDTQEIDDSQAQTFHVDFDLEIVNESDRAVDLGLEIDGPWGTPSETWWYQNKIHGDTWAIGSIAGARDVVGSSPKETFNFVGGPQIVKNEKKAEPKYLWIFNSFDRDVAFQTVNFIGVDTQYFDVLLIPDGPEPFVCYSALAVPADVEIPKNARLQKLVDCSFRLFKGINLTGNGNYSQSFQIFVGPKEPQLLATYGLDAVRSFGWFALFSKPLCWLLELFHTLTFQFGYGIPIILLTVLVRSLMIPISRKAAINAQMMQHLQPQIKQIAEKYKDDMEKRSQAQRDLFKKYNYNPFGGCFMMFLQLPIFIGLYRGLSVDIALRDQPLIPGLPWCTDLAAPDQLFYWGNWMPPFLGGETGWLGPYFNLLPIITICLFLVQQKLFTPPAADEQQQMAQKMMKFMMIVMGVMFFKVPSGLCLYFITSSAWGIIERKMLPKPELDTSKLPTFDDDAPADKATLKKKAKIEAKAIQLETRRQAEQAEVRRLDRERKKRLKQRGI